MSIRFWGKFRFRPERSPARRAAGQADLSPAGSRPRYDPPTGWVGVFLGMQPFFIFGTTYLAQAAAELGWLPGWPDVLVRSLPLLAYGLVSSGLILAWILSFPRWSLAFLGMGVYFGYSTSQTLVFGNRYGLIGWLPLLTGLVVGLLISRSFEPLKHLVSSIRRDWTRLSFGIYAFLLPLMAIFFLDSDWGRLEYYGLIYDTVLLVAGAVVFLRSRTIWRRVMSLQVVMVFMLVRGVLMGDWLGGSGSLAANRLPSLMLVFLLWAGLLFAPGLIGLLRWGLQSGNPPPEE